MAAIAAMDLHAMLHATAGGMSEGAPPEPRRRARSAAEAPVVGVVGPTGRPDLVQVGRRPLAEGARLLAPFTAMGVAPEAASSYLFPRRMGRQRAAEILFTSAWLSADEAVAAGLALRACPDDRVLDETLELARSVAAQPLASLVATKKLIMDAERAGVARAREAENAAFAELLRRAGADQAILGQLDRKDQPSPPRSR